MFYIARGLSAKANFMTDMHQRADYKKMALLLCGVYV